MKFSIESAASYNSIHPAYRYTERFADNGPNYQEGTKWSGVLLAFVSGTFFTVSSALVKAVRNVDPMTLLGIRSILQMLAMLVASVCSSKNLLGPPGQRLLIHLQGFVGGMTLSLLYYSFRKLPLGDATTIIFSSPVIVIALSFLFLKEPCGLLRITVVCTLFAGVVFVARPPFLFQVRRQPFESYNDSLTLPPAAAHHPSDTFPLFQMQREEPYDAMGYVCAVLATLFTALNIVVTRKCSEIHYSVLVFNLSAWALLSAVFFYFVASGGHGKRFALPTDCLSWGEILLVALTGLAGQVLVTKALKIEGAGKVSVTRSLDIILAYVIQTYFFGEEPSSTSIFGATLIILSVVCMGFEKEIYGACDFIP